MASNTVLNSVTLHKSLTPNCRIILCDWFLSTLGNIKYLQSTYSLPLSFLDDRKLIRLISLCWLPSLLFWRCKIFQAHLEFSLQPRLAKDHFGQVIPSFTTLSDFQRIKSLLWFQGYFFFPSSLNPWCSPPLLTCTLVTWSSDNF